MQEENLCRVALTCHSAPDGIVRTDPLELFCLEPGSVVVVLRVMTDELQDGGKNEIAESERWSSYAVDEDDGTSSGTEHSLFPWSGGTNGRLAVWMTPNLRVTNRPKWV